MGATKHSEWDCISSGTPGRVLTLKRTLPSPNGSRLLGRRLSLRWREPRLERRVLHKVAGVIEETAGRHLGPPKQQVQLRERPEGRGRAVRVDGLDTTLGRSSKPTQSR